MNILYIAHEKELNGASKSLLGIIDELLYKNVNIHVLTPYKSGKFYDEIKKRDVNIVYSKYFRWVIRKPENNVKWYIKKYIYKLLNLMNILTIIRTTFYSKEVGIDIIHSNSSVIDIGAHVSKLTKIPHIFHIREFGEEDFKMYPIHKKDKWLNFINRNSEGIIVISKALFEKYKDSFKIDKIKVIYNGIDKKFINNKVRVDKGDYNMLIAGRIEEAKGQEEAILAIEELQKRNINNIKLTIIGAGDKSKIMNIIYNKGLENKISVQDYCDNLFEIRKDIDFELVCSKNEAFGRVTIEAMMSSNPVIGSNTGGTKELIIDGFNGFLYKQGDSKDLSIKIEKLINCSNFNEISKNALKYSSERFTSEINAINILAVYEDIIAKNKII